ncbi:N-6 DNA methylase [Streptomyces sp. HU2014]|uniref:N-6 DNA methylase n=1 Tax=Streptomyces sp. HU2014 TaxID=2939414 RepID=UPI00200CFDD5|nr:N-6 DNA methylase [Streptomyces sp. HU2014]UQI43330.1 N-6 DNA methylase [Streptomyces sp. HU2014]
MQESAAEVTAAGIARLAGVGRAAVSNWRRRHPDFPQPIGGTETSPTFALGDVETWLRHQGKLAEVPLRERVWQQLSGDPAGAVAALRTAGAVLLLVHDRPTTWLELAALTDLKLAEELPTALEAVLAARLGERHPVTVPGPAELAVSSALLRGAAELAAGRSAAQVYEFLLGRHLDANPRQYTLTPAGPAELMAALALGLPQGAAQDPADRPRPHTVLDPACGTGGLLHAAVTTGTPAPAGFHGQEADPELAALAALRLALHTDGRVRVRAGDSLRADAFADSAADAVLCHPPFNERNWGHEELAYDPRWEYGFPARTESELAWVQHALARLRPGGTAVLLMPPAVASRRSGRRIRADLLRRGALRAVIALPAGAAPPYGIPLHLWVLSRPGAQQSPTPHVLLVDTAGAGGPAPAGREKLPWQAVRTAALEAWADFDRHGTVAERPGRCRSLPVIDLLDDDVDLAPARHLPPPAAGGGAAELADVHDRLTLALRRAGDLAPALPGEPADPARWPATTVGELARAGALVLRAGGSGAVPEPGADAPPVLTDYDVKAGGAPSGTLPEGPAEEPVLVEAGDVVVPVLGDVTAARVVDEATAGAALGRGLFLLRPDPAALDAWFLAGFLRGSANQRQASSYASTATRLDVRRLQVPRLPLADQRRYGARFRELAAFEEALRLTERLGERLVQGLYDGLTDGTVRPE